MIQFYHYVLSHFLNKHHKVKIESETVVSLLFIVYYSQLICLLQQNQENASDYQTQINLLNLFQYYGQIWRPYNYLFKYKGFRQYAFIIPSLLITLIIVDFFLQWMEEVRIKKTQQSKLKFKGIHNNNEKILSIIFQVHLYTISLYELDLFMLSIREATLNLPDSIQMLTFSIFFLFCKLLFILLTLMCSESIHFPSSPIHFNILSIGQYLNMILVVIDLYLNHEKGDLPKTLSLIMNLFIFGFYIYQECQKKVTYLNTLVLLLLTYCFFNNLSYFFVIQTTYKEYRIALLFVLCPLFLNLIVHYSKHSTKIIYEKNRTIEEIFNNLLLLNENQYKNLKSEKFETLMYKQLSTYNNDPFHSELILFNNKIIKSRKNKKAFWYYKYILIKLSQMQYTETLILIHNFRESFFYSEVNKQFVRVQIVISFIQQLKLINLKSEVYQLLNYNITKNFDLDKLNSNSFINYKVQIQKSQNQIMKIFQEKEALYIQLLEGKSSKINSIFNKSYKILEDSLQIQQDLRLELINSKTYRIHQLLTMLYVEFFNNIIQAELLKYFQLNNEELKQNPLENMDFLNLKLEDNLINTQIKYFSQSLLIRLGYKVKDEQNFQFKMLFPDAFYEIHQNLIKLFLENGVCKYLNKISDMLIRGQDNIYFYSQFQLNIENSLVSELSFYVFLKINEDQPNSIFINKQHQIIGYTTTFLKYINKKNSNLTSKALFLLELTKLIDFNKQHLKQKFMKGSFIIDQSQIILEIVERKSILELQILEEDLDFLLNQEIFSQEQSYPCSLALNQESVVLIPNQLFLEDLNSPLSQAKREKPYQELLQSEIKQYQTMKSREVSNVNSELIQEKQKNSKQSIKDQKDEIDNDQASSKFSRGFLDNSIFYQKYNKLNSFLSESKRNRQITIILILFLLALFINIIFQLINLIQFLPQYKKVNADVDMLTLKGNFMAPIHNCVTAQVCVVNYMLLAFLFKEISQEQAYSKMQFGLDSILKSYDHLKESFTTQLDNQNLQEFFYDQEIQMYQQENLSLVPRNISLKSALIYYQEAQYFTTIIDYYNVLSVISSSEFVYYMANIIAVDDYFDYLNDEVQIFVDTRIQIFESDQTKFFLKMVFLEVLIVSLGVSFILQNQYTLSDLFSLFTNINIFALQKEIFKLQKWIQLLNHDDAYQIYNFEVSVWEKDVSIQSFPYNLKINLNRIIKQEYKPPRLGLILVFSIILIIYLLPQLILQSLNSSFFEKYSQSAALLVKLSKLGSAVTAVYEIREINYMISGQSPFFDFFTDQKRIEQNVKVVDELAKINDFLTFYLFFDFDSSLTDDDFIQKFENVQSQNLCNFIIHYNKSLAEEHCNLIYDGVMKLGLINTLTEIYRQINTEFENTQGFQIKNRNKSGAFEEAEIGLIASDAVLYLQSEVFNAIVLKTSELIQAHQILIGIYIIMSVILLLILVYYYYPYLMRRTMIVKNMIFLIPQLQFYLDQKFETDFRVLQMQNV
ncbi:unnamed protein product [Paramecium sonneborni]|uniref:Transmembrane protein n=1 Tax=Paramecium sonneborni TaxID=65129 RepID=A0A8S1MF62_9CILI|nr:unnamed protein product [Paramecium sonneborni]